MMVLGCMVLIITQVYLDLRIPEYMSEITYHLQAGGATDIIASSGRDMILCALISLALGILTATLAARVASSLSRTLRDKQYQQVKTWSREDLDSFSVASLITRSTNDVYQIMTYMGRAIQLVFKAPILAVWAIYKIASESFQWTSVTLVAMLVLIGSMYVILRMGTPYIRKTQWLVDSINETAREELEGMRTIRAYNGERQQTAKFNRTSDDLLDNSITAARIFAPLHPIASSMMNFLTMAIYWVGAGIINGTPGTEEQMVLFSDMIVFTSYATQVLSAVMMTTGILRQLPHVRVASNRIEEVIDHVSGIRDGDMTAADATEPGCIEFRDVSFTYPGADKESLHGISFRVERGETLAIIGPTASGKTTLVNLIPRLYEATSGQVLVGGRDVREYDQDELVSMLGYVPQIAVVFSGTMRDNIAYTDRPYTNDEIARAVRIAQLDELVERMPEGVDSDISQHGWNLSGGQKQRLSIARAVCKDPDVFLFDDTFSALDSKTDSELRAALDEEVSGTTRIIVAQRVGTILGADRIIVLEKGRIVGSGRHDELMETCELYREIARSQLEDFDGE